MKRIPFILITLLLAASFLGIATIVNAALVNWESHMKWKREKLQEVVAEVQKKGSSPVFSAAVKPYDKNMDAVIDQSEVKAIEDFLGGGEKKNP